MPFSTTLEQTFHSATVMSNQSAVLLTDRAAIVATIQHTFLTADQIANKRALCTTVHATHQSTCQCSFKAAIIATDFAANV